MECKNSHTHSEEVLELQLGDIVADVFVVHQVAVRIGGFVVADALGYVGLVKDASVVRSTRHGLRDTGIRRREWNDLQSAPLPNSR